MNQQAPDGILCCAPHPQTKSINLIISTSPRNVTFSQPGITWSALERSPAGYTPSFLLRGGSCMKWWVLCSSSPAASFPSLQTFSSSAELLAVCCMGSYLIHASLSKRTWSFNSLSCIFLWFNTAEEKIHDPPEMLFPLSFRPRLSYVWFYVRGSLFFFSHCHILQLKLTQVILNHLRVSPYINRYFCKSLRGHWHGDLSWI